MKKKKYECVSTYLEKKKNDRKGKKFANRDIRVRAQ